MDLVIETLDIDLTSDIVRFGFSGRVHLRSLVVPLFPDSRPFTVPVYPLASLAVDSDGDAPERRRNPVFSLRKNTIDL